MAVPKLIIFECDGILVDTETLANREIARRLTARGLSITYAQSRERFVGMSMTSLVKRVLAEDGVALGDDFVDSWYENLPHLFSAGVNAIDGIADAVDMIKQAGAQYCVASSGTVEKMHLTLGSAGLLPYFHDRLFSATMVQNGKPAPDLFLHAAAAMGYVPADCVVIEDSPFGAQAARRAAMKCFGYTGDPHTNADGLSHEGATLFNDMRALPGLIGLL